MLMLIDGRPCRADAVELASGAADGFRRLAVSSPATRRTGAASGRARSASSSMVIGRAADKTGTPSDGRAQPANGSARRAVTPNLWQSIHFCGQRRPASTKIPATSPRIRVALHASRSTSISTPAMGFISTRSDCRLRNTRSDRNYRESFRRRGCGGDGLAEACCKSDSRSAAESCSSSSNRKTRSCGEPEKNRRITCPRVLACDCFARNQRLKHKTSPLAPVADEAFFFENSQHRADRGIVRLARQLRPNLFGGRRAELPQLLHDFGFAIGQADG